MWISGSGWQSVARSALTKVSDQSKYIFEEMANQVRLKKNSGKFDSNLKFFSSSRDLGYIQESEANRLKSASRLYKVRSPAFDESSFEFIDEQRKNRSNRA